MSRRKSSSGMKRKKLGRDYCFGGHTHSHNHDGKKDNFGTNMQSKLICNTTWYQICNRGFDIVFDNKH